MPTTQDTLEQNRKAFKVETQTEEITMYAIKDKHYTVSYGF